MEGVNIVVQIDHQQETIDWQRKFSSKSKAYARPRQRQQMSSFFKQSQYDTLCGEVGFSSNVEQLPGRSHIGE